jgi:hypothetical protein
MSDQARALLAGILAFASGFAVWAILSLAAGQMQGGRLIVREAWDTPAYFILGLPLLLAVAAISGGLAPVRVWRWPLLTAAGQVVAMVLVHPPGTDLALAPVAVVFIGVPLIVAMTLAAVVGAVIARRGWSSAILA